MLSHACSLKLPMTITKKRKKKKKKKGEGGYCSFQLGILFVEEVLPPPPPPTQAPGHYNGLWVHRGLTVEENAEGLLVQLILVIG